MRSASAIRSGKLQPLSQFRARPISAEHRSGAFSLIELIAVVTILGILITATLPAFIRKADDTAGANEIANLETLARGFQYGVAHSRYIPGFSDWAAFLTTNVSWHLNTVQTNSRNNARVFLVDPSFSIGPTTATSLPYVQNTNAYQLVSPRFLILSSISMPLPISTGPVSQADFSVLWNYPANGLPSGWNWKGATNDLEIQRIDLTPSFSRLILSNLTTTAAPFVLDKTAYAMQQGPLASFLFSGTVLNLTNLSNAPQISEMINKQTAWAFTESVTESLMTNTTGKGKGVGAITVTTNYLTNFFWVPQPP